MISELEPFPCTSCGKCCQQVSLSSQTAYLDRGDGTCQYFDDMEKLCTIYDERPLVCRVEGYYKKYLSQQYEWDDFVRINLEFCEKLKNG